MNKLGLTAAQLFQPRLDILNSILESRGKMVTLDEELQQLATWFDGFKEKAAATDVSLKMHVEAVKVKTETKLKQLEKKLQRAERKKLEAEERQLERLQATLFPNGTLQERVENIGSYYAKWGPEFIDALYEKVLPLESNFVVLREESGLPA